MRRTGRAVFTFALVVSAGSCIFVTAKSDFSIDNQSTSAIIVTYTNSDDQDIDVAVPASARVALTSVEYAESNMVLPSQAIKKLVVSVDNGAGPTVRYTQDPIVDSEWRKQAGTEPHSFLFDFVVTQSML